MDPYEIADMILRGHVLPLSDARVLSDSPLPDLLNGANLIRTRFCGNRATLCTIINARSGRCSENCRYCAQSSHYCTDTEVYPLLPEDEILSTAKHNEANGAHRFSLVTSGRSQGGDNFEEILEVIRRIRRETRLTVCASLGFLTLEKARRLREAGLSYYHHNLEACRDYFPETCTTHTWMQRAETIRVAHQAGLKVCSGGIFGLGESRMNRLQMACELRELEVQSVPLNLLSPIPGTPFEHLPPLPVDEILRCMALYRYILPTCEIRFAGGRGRIRGHFGQALLGGINSALTGNYLTTTGTTFASDIALFRKLGYDLSGDKE